MHKKVLFYADQEFKLEIIFQNRVDSHRMYYHSKSNYIEIRNLSRLSNSTRQRELYARSERVNFSH